MSSRELAFTVIAHPRHVEKGQPAFALEATCDRCGASFIEEPHVQQHHYLFAQRMIRHVCGHPDEPLGKTRELPCAKCEGTGRYHRTDGAGGMYDEPCVGCTNGYVLAVLEHSTP